VPFVDEDRGPVLRSLGIPPYGILTNYKPVGDRSDINGGTVSLSKGAAFPSPFR
jgi:hypothetical protein